MTTRTYSEDLRRRVIRAVGGGLSARAAAAKCDVSVSFVIKLVQRWRETGSHAAKQRGGYLRPVLEAHTQWLCDLVERPPDWTLQALADHLAEQKG